MPPKFSSPSSKHRLVLLVLTLCMVVPISGYFLANSRNAENHQICGEPDSTIFGDWRNDDRGHHISFSSNQRLEWFIYKGFDGDAYIGKYAVINPNLVKIDLSQGSYLGVIASGTLFATGPYFGITTYRKGHPILEAPNIYHSAVIACFSKKTSPAELEKAILRLQPIALTIYPSKGDFQRVAIEVEKQNAHAAELIARESRLFTSVKLATNAGEDRTEQLGTRLQIGEPAADLIFTIKDSAHTERVHATIKSLGGKLVSAGKARFNGPTLVAPYLVLRDHPDVADIKPEREVPQHVLLLSAKPDADPEKISSAIMEMNPHLIAIDKIIDGQRLIAVSLPGPSSLKDCHSKAMRNPLFFSARLPSNKVREKDPFLSNMVVVDLEAKGDPRMFEFSPKKGISQGQFEKSLKKIGTTNWDGIHEYDRYHCIAPVIRALDDPHVDSIFQGPPSVPH